MAEFDYREKMVSDLLEQFRGKKNIDVIVESYAAQLQEVYEFLLSLLNLLDLDACTGAQLDLIGGIVVLTRYDARVMVGESYEGEVLDDDPVPQAHQVEDLAKHQRLHLLVDYEGHQDVLG